jgi:predicted HTH domain antitoxin
LDAFFGLQFLDDLQLIEKFSFMLLFAPDSTGKFTQPVKGNMKFQKEMFVLSKLVKGLEDETEFTAYAMGSFSDNVEEIEDQFCISGFAEKRDDSIVLSFEGKKMAERIWENATERERDVVSKVKSLLNDLPEHELLALVYTEYPESAANSRLVGFVDKHRPDAAMGLLRKGKISLPSALQIARMSQPQFENFLKVRGHKLADFETSSVLADKELMDEIEKSRADSRSRRLVPWEKIRDSQ